MGIMEKLWTLAKEAKTPEATEAYMIALLYVEDYLNEQKELRKKERIEREESALALANVIVAACENFKKEEN